MQDKFVKVNKFRITIVGPERSGKTSIFQKLLDLPPLDDQTTNSHAQLGLKMIMDKDIYCHPTSLRVCDVPGGLSNFKKSSKFAFEKPDIVLILIDSTILIEREDVLYWNQLVIDNILAYHRSVVATSNQDEEQKDMNEGIEIENISHRLVTAKFGYNSKEDEDRNDLYHSFSNKHHLMNTDEKIFEDSFELN